jgi:hypothetical protein
LGGIFREAHGVKRGLNPAPSQMRPGLGSSLPASEELGENTEPFLSL